MVADFSKWKFNQWPFFPEKLSGSEGNGEKIGSFCLFLENGQHVEDLTNFTPTTSSSKNSGPNRVTYFVM